MNKRNDSAVSRVPRRLPVHRLWSLSVCLLVAFGVVWLAGAQDSAAKQKRAKRRAAAATASRTGARRNTRTGRVARNASPAKPSERFFEPTQEEDEAGEDVEGRQKFFYLKRAYPFNTIPANARRRAWESRPRAAKGRTELLAQHEWTPIGPAPTSSFDAWGVTSGRINAIAVSPANPQLVLVGASTGGIWRSTDGGATFSPVSDTQVDLAVGSIAFAPSNPSIVYAGMGDLDNSYLGTGLLKSTDAGQTWARVSNDSLPAQALVTDVVVSPNDPNRVYVTQAASLNLNVGQIFTSGLFTSTDGGVNWTRKISGNARKIAIHPADPQTIYVAMRTIDPPGTPGLYKSTDGGANFSLAYTSPYGPSSTRDIRVAVTPADPQRVYVSVGRTIEPAEVRVEVSSDAGANWTNRGALGIDLKQFGYNTYLNVSPADANTLYVGSRDVYKSMDGGFTWANITRNFSGPAFQYNPSISNTHPDQQSFAFSTDNPNVLYIGNDGGISKSTDGGLSFQSRNQTLSLTQFVSLSLHPNDPSISYGGTQDNGTQRRLNGTSSWREFSSGDGGRNIINPTNPGMVFTTYVYGVARRYTNNGLTYSGDIATDSSFGESSDPETRRILFYPPFVGNGVDHRLYFGTYRLFICENCNDTTKRLGGLNPPTWTSPGGSFDQTKCGLPFPPSPCFDALSAIGVARSNTQIIYTGSSMGRAMVSGDGGASWTDITSGLPNRFIESITVDPNNADTAFLTVSGYAGAIDPIRGHVFKTVNRGASWTDISGNLPNTPANALLVDPLNSGTLYVGTDIGVFRSTAGGNTWETFNTGMPPVVVTAFSAQASGRIQVATYGRGAYELTTNNTTPPASVNFDAAGYNVAENGGSVRITLNRSDASLPASVAYATTDGTASDRSDYTAAIGTLRFNAGEASKSFDIFVTDDVLAESTETVNVTLSNPVNLLLGTPNAVSVQITNNDAVTGANPVKDPTFDAQFFVRQHYIDFFNREPDAAGLAFWTSQITSCATQECREIRRINVSAAFFVSTEFQETGYLVYRFYQAAFNTNEQLRLRDFLPDTQEIGRGVIVNQGAWQAQLEANKQTYANAFVARPQFTAQYGAMNNAQYVDALNANTGNSLAQGERDDLLNKLNGGQLTRAQVLRAV
ncbi:MAG TPA: Calx-beta domain-containing protein, partial [Pyrinomonadaceae bacterium]|nr:Calx-beta domain-containing protein [Pyrinomonadaceae bacterium]